MYTNSYFEIELYQARDKLYAFFFVFVQSNHFVCYVFLIKLHSRVENTKLSLFLDSLSLSHNMKKVNSKLIYNLHDEFIMPNQKQSLLFN